MSNNEREKAICQLCGKPMPRGEEMFKFHGYSGPCPEERILFHISKDDCDHDFQGWRDFEDGNGGEQVCTKCGMGAMAHSLRTGP